MHKLLTSSGREDEDEDEEDEITMIDEAVDGIGEDVEGVDDNDDDAGFKIKVVDC